MLKALLSSLILNVLVDHFGLFTDMKGITMLENRLNNSGLADFNVTKEVIKEVDALSEKLKKSILEAKDELTVAGKCYYVSENGDDSNDGLSMETPKKTIAGVNALELCPGDGVFFKRGDIFRGELQGKAGVTYAAYGEGIKPRLYGCPENGADASKWTLVDGTDNIWRYKTLMTDVGVIVFNEDECCSVKKIPSFVGGKYVLRYDKNTEFDIRKHMDRDLCHFSKSDSELDEGGFPKTGEPIGELYLRCDRGNPGEVFDSIEFCTKNFIIKCPFCNGIRIDNLTLKYCGYHGIWSGGIDGITVTNCEIGWIGGCVHGFSRAEKTLGDVTGVGNGIEVYGNSKNVLLEHNYIYQCYDAGMTHQAARGLTYDIKMTNITYSENLIEYCTYSYEYFLGAPDDTVSVRYQKDIKVINNIMRYSGFGFGEMRPSPDGYFPAAHIKGWHHANYLDENYVIEGNIFDRARDMMIHCCAAKGEYLPKFRNNIFVGYKGEGAQTSFGHYCSLDNNSFLPYNENTVDEIKKTDSTCGIYFAERDGLFELPDYLPKHDRT